MKHLLIIGEAIDADWCEHFDITCQPQWQSDRLPDGVDAVIITTKDEDTIDTALSILRQSNDAWLKLIYCRYRTRLADSLSDGTMPQTPDAMLDALLSYERRLARLHPEIRENTTSNLEKRLIAWLWVNAQRRIKPQRVLATTSMYRYPLMDLWDEYPAKEFWLANAARHELLKREDLIDRVRACSKCNSGMLNFIDTCPNCQSIEVHSESAIHCFTCGHIASQKYFVRQNTLTCPNCLTRLRHIGTDYDKPLEDQQCDNCNTLFIEAEVRAHCLYCNHDNNLDELRVHQYYCYRLGNLGVTRAQTGSDEHFTPIMMDHAISRSQFTWMIDWVANLAPRQDKTHMILAMKFNNLAQLSESESEIELLNHLEEFGERLTGVLRKTDVFCRYTTDVLMFLLTDADQKAINLIRQRIELIQKEQVNNPLDISVLFQIFPKHSDNELAEPWLRSIYEALYNDADAA